VKKEKGEPFVMMFCSVFDSDEYAALSSIARSTLWLLIRRNNGSNNGTIPLGVREAARWSHCGQMTACRALDELVKAGFITVTDKGRMVRSGDNRATRWKLNFPLVSKRDARRVTMLPH
jgi:hypothetical protein